LIRVLYVAFTEGSYFSLSHFINFFERALFKESKVDKAREKADNLLETFGLSSQKEKIK
jgi:hypothetical protein